MQYIVLDLEWNQPWPGSPSSKKVLPSPIRGEIIQIGAVRLSEQQEVLDEFTQLVMPKYYRRLNRRVSSLTGIKEARLKAEGVSFPEAVERFAAWCGEDAVFLTWGFDDILILRENLALHALAQQWTERWYNAQMMFNAQTDGSTNQKALKTALEIFGIEATRPAHDALGDAYHTALVCAKLDLKAGMDGYRAALRDHEDGLNGALLPGCVERKVYHGIADKRAALKKMETEENHCPTCGKQMCVKSKWYTQPGHRLTALAACPEHGDFVLRLKLSPEEEEQTLRVTRMVYTAESETGEAFRRLQEKPRPKRRRSRRRRSGGPKQQGGSNARV